MKSKRISVLILSIALFLSITLILVGSGLSKREVNTERITFSGDLYGDQEVVGCCGNAGPGPNYTMTLSEEVFPQEMTGEEHDGNIFMNNFGRKMQWAYKVQFWWGEGGDDYFYEYFIEIRGGEAHKDKKTKILTVTFIDVPCYEIWKRGDLLTENLEVIVNFTLTRDPHHSANK